ncbi:Eukaryotic translation initiation factor 3 subunit C like [Melia azedarach]|uniref:Eukaryotic translation initiation factor 3 subunit C like n=1 Tax=Melia azedarach TaxID=155640 RepID=A0ACC1Z3Z9_MELAZ|nr:Eukaryotic translation initiation factor 3 subunit C like [Melia azedarach]
MKLENRTEDPMALSPFCDFFNKPFSWISALVLSLIFISIFLGFGFFSILFTSLVLIVSSLLFTITKQKPVTEEINNLNSDIHQNNESVKPQKEAEVEHKIHDYSIKSPDLLSESESLNQLSSSEESEIEWPYREIADCSDGSISDEESDLIEISLPSGHYVPASKFNLQQNKVVADFSTHSVLKQHSLMELLAEINEMNEEENLIEIDISMGSIKCSRFEIEA